MIADVLMLVGLYVGGNLMIKGSLGCFLSDMGVKYPKIKITLPKNKKYLSGKQSPIYKAVLNNEFDFQYIKKYELRHDEVEDFIYLLGIFLVPIFNLRTIAYQYHKCRTLGFNLTEDEFLNKIGDTELSEFYEKELKLREERESAIKAVENEKQSKVDKLNRIFNENYE
jgi:hypothetical protein